jgi:hypothetical protein
MENEILDAGENFKDHSDVSYGRPTPDSKVVSIKESDLQHFTEMWAPSKTSVTEMLKGKGITHLIIEDVDGVKGAKEIIQLEPKKTKVRGRAKDGGLYGVGLGLGMIPMEKDR